MKGSLFSKITRAYSAKNGRGGPIRFNLSKNEERKAESDLGQALTNFEYALQWNPDRHLFEVKLGKVNVVMVSNVNADNSTMSQ